ncbi:gamma-glutamylcyclotransferase family protein [Solidesulfovibrio sp.]|uniref:gamma-glutamylcyclotransferase family protein n=1 Tax=Solidesulfovibrio sp. TaxID=2910990 RepID=UPI002B1FFA9C|nr:gamma-glutamylcyclotransferase family protein [Solidesulfovibrio sp.]MEA5089622.1 gamma-glutamylcyclotransferase family protein [Solidesulfovibrio sp.]HML59991.1 gamma-glutamylcyclotransferase [Solidesulfovibrio sp.]
MEAYWDIFAYGTLRQGFHNHHYMADCFFLGRAETALAYAMYVAGGIPYLALDEPLHRVTGEVYRVDAARLRAIDALEEHPRVYRRALAPLVMTGDGSPADAWIYFARRPWEGVLHTGDFASWRPSRT